MTEILRAFLRIFLLCLAINAMRNIGLCLLHADGLVNISAITALIVYSETQSFALTIFAGALVTLAINISFIYLTKKKGASDIVYGIAMNLILRGLSGLMLYLYAGELAMSSSVNVNFDVKVFGTDIFIVLGLFLSVIYYIYLYKTKAGLNLRAVGLDEEKALFRKIDILNLKKRETSFQVLFV